MKMDKVIFEGKKQNLINLINVLLKEESCNKQAIDSLNHVLFILGKYTFEDRLQVKGLLSHTLIDSLELNYSLGEKFIKFDNDIE
jgi:hypothetical protein